MHDPITRYTPLDQLPALLRPEEAAIVLGVSKGLVYEMARRGDIKGVRLGRLLRIPKEQLAGWAEGGNGGR